MKATLLLLAFLTTPLFAADLTPGVSLFGEHKYIEYIPGDLPLVIAAPHGGSDVPADIPDRTTGVTARDANTEELARTIAQVVHRKTGGHMPLIISRLHRKKLDPNRELAEAAGGNPVAGKAWTEYHEFVEQACAAAVKQHGAAFFIDLHGQSHPDIRVELGYLHTARDLASGDEEINKPAFIAKGSYGLVAAKSALPYVQILRGPESLGALLEKHGFPSTPSPRMPVPTEPFFSGGYTVRRHCDEKRRVAGLQIECNRPNLRDTKENRQRFAEALVTTLEEYLPARLSLSLNAPPAGKGAPAR